MKLGIALGPQTLGGGPPAPDSLATTSRLAEELGYSSLWVFDAVGRGFMLPDPLMALTVAATVTDSVELGTGVLQLPIRYVPEVAHRALTLQMLAGDRLMLGVGPGSTATDFATFGGDYATRFTRFEEQLAELREWLTTGGSGDVNLSPWPSVASGPRLLLAGWRGGWVERAATEADGWVASGFHADDATLADGIARYRAAGGERAIVTNVQIGADLGPGLERLHALAELGFDDAIAFDLTPTEDRYQELINRYRS